MDKKTRANKYFSIFIKCIMPCIWCIIESWISNDCENKFSKVYIFIVLYMFQQASGRVQTSFAMFVKYPFVSSRFRLLPAIPDTSSTSGALTKVYETTLCILKYLERMLSTEKSVYQHSFTANQSLTTEFQRSHDMVSRMLCGLFTVMEYHDVPVPSDTIRFHSFFFTGQGNRVQTFQKHYVLLVLFEGMLQECTNTISKTINDLS